VQGWSAPAVKPSNISQLASSSSSCHHCSTENICLSWGWVIAATSQLSSSARVLFDWATVNSSGHLRFALYPPCYRSIGDTLPEPSQSFHLFMFLPYGRTFLASFEMYYCLALNNACMAVSTISQSMSFADLGLKHCLLDSPMIKDWWAFEIFPKEPLPDFYCMFSLNQADPPSCSMLHSCSRGPSSDPFCFSHSSISHPDLMQEYFDLASIWWPFICWNISVNDNCLWRVHIELMRS